MGQHCHVMDAIGPAHYCSTREQTRRGLPRESTHNPGSAHFVPSTLVPFLSVEQTAFHSFILLRAARAPCGLLNDPSRPSFLQIPCRSWPPRSFSFCSPVSLHFSALPLRMRKHTLSSLTTSELVFNLGYRFQLIVVQVRTRNGMLTPRRVQRPSSSLHCSLNSFWEARLSRPGSHTQATVPLLLALRKASIHVY